MSEAFQHKLFQPFEQELPAGTSNEKGTAWDWQSRTN